MITVLSSVERGLSNKRNAFQFKCQKRLTFLKYKNLNPRPPWLTDDKTFRRATKIKSSLFQPHFPINNTPINDANHERFCSRNENLFNSRDKRSNYLAFKLLKALSLPNWNATDTLITFSSCFQSETPKQKFVAVLLRSRISAHGQYKF